LDRINQWDYLQKPFPKSLHIDTIYSSFQYLQTENFVIEDVLSTLVEAISQHISNVLNITKESKKVLITGGGAHNTFLIDRLQSLTHHQITVPFDKNQIDFKEAIVFAFLGYQRWIGESNTLSSVTGASKDSCGGMIM
jgi:anhydro-N-acetylmuramic acid kinase